MYIPVRLPENAFDLARTPREAPPPHGRGRGTDRRDVFGSHSDAPAFPPGLREVSGELDRLLTRLAPPAHARRSHAGFGVDRGQFERGSTLTSSAPINEATSSYQKVQLGFGASTAVGRLSGVYRGAGAATGATALTITIDSAAEVSGQSTAVSFHVSDQDGNNLFSYAGNVKAGEAISLGSDIGLALSFGEGGLVQGSTGKTAVWRTTATTVDKNARFGDPDPNLRPRFEADRAVVPGSFTVDGTLIEVTADDSIASILQQISEKVPGLEVSYDAEQITLSTRDATRRAVEVGNDTSGFLAASKLLGVAGQTGAIDQHRERLAESSRFASVGAGSFRMGDAIITVDPAQDTLAGLLDKMSAAAPGVTAYYDATARQVVLRGADDKASLLGEDTSGFLAAVGLAEGRELGAREGFTLAPGAAARLERGAAAEKVGMMAATLLALGLAPEDELSAEAGATGAQGTARKARAAYGREVEEAREREKKAAALGAPAAGRAGREPARASRWPGASRAGADELGDG